MSLVERIKECLDKQTLVSGEELDEIIGSPKFEGAKPEIISHILANLDYPNLNALKIAYFIPSNHYEEKLLLYKPKDMADSQAIYWMLALGQIKSTAAFDKIKFYIDTPLFHQAFISMFRINPDKTMHIFEKFLDGHCHAYNSENPSSRHDSGFNTLLMLLEDYKGNPGDLVRNYDRSNCKKRKLIEDALAEVKESIHG